MLQRRSLQIAGRNVRDGRPVTCEVPFFQFPGMSQFPELAHFVFTRHGGVSDSVFRSLNVSASTGDSPTNVEANLSLIREVTGAESLRFMNQAHGKNIMILRKGSPENGAEPVMADAMVTDAVGVALLVKQADCQALILYDPLRKAVANVHCGWRGNAQDILSDVIAAMKEEFDCEPPRMRAAIGPSLGPCCAEFVNWRQELPAAMHRHQIRENHFDFWAISKEQLIEAGVQAAHIETVGICTVCNQDFFSYRRAVREQGRPSRTGRCGSVIALPSKQP